MEQPNFSILENMTKLDFLSYIKTLSDKKYKYKTSKGIEYYQISASFDIETTSFYDNDNKCAVMYVWALCVEGRVYQGRTWNEYTDMMNTIAGILDTGNNTRFVIYAHNLSYEFQFLRKWCNWEKVFAVKDRAPVYAITDNGIEYRCSYILTGLPLYKLADKITITKIHKIPDYDYNKMRFTSTPLTADEYKYNAYDVIIVTAYIHEQITAEKNIQNIPLTNTGYVRRKFRVNCLYDGKRAHRKLSHAAQEYQNIIHNLTIAETEYLQLKRAFQGGFTHASCLKSGKTFYNVKSYDFTSSYPAVMVAEMFPMSPAEHVTISTRAEFAHNLNNYCCMFDCEFTNICSKKIYENPISISRCWGIVNAVNDNGRVFSADRLCTTVTEQDFKTILNFYSWEDLKISNFTRYKKGYLPRQFVLTLLELYKNKTTLKDVPEEIMLYMLSKGMLNSAYGMCVTDIVRDVISYTTDWETTEPILADEIKKYNNSRTRFLFYPWGVWVTAYARRNLFTAIEALGSDYIYSDTDSVKLINADKHQQYFDNYNANIQNKIKTALKTQNIDPELAQPKTIKNKIKPLGVWDFDGEYSEFKTLGAKRYLVRYADNGKLSATVAGVPKKAIENALEKTSSPFGNFANNLTLSPAESGKKTHTYIDNEISGQHRDYLGNMCDFYEKSCVHLENAPFSMSMTDYYIDFLKGLNKYE